MGRGWRYEAEQADGLFDDYRNQNISNEYHATIAKATKKETSAKFITPFRKWEQND